MPQVMIPPFVLRDGQSGTFETCRPDWGLEKPHVVFDASDGPRTDTASDAALVPSKWPVAITNGIDGKRGFAAERSWKGANDGPLRLHGRNCPQDGPSRRIDGMSACSASSVEQALGRTGGWDHERRLMTWRSA